MIYWFTGQPAHGKTTLAKMLYNYLVDIRGAENVYHIDGDDIRELFSNKDYSINGRVQNVSTAQRIAQYLSKKNKSVIVSIVSPYIDQREDFKNQMGKDIIEFYVHTSLKTERENNRAIAYMKPVERYIDIETTHDEPIKSFRKVLEAIKQYSYIRFEI